MAAPPTPQTSASQFSPRSEPFLDFENRFLVGEDYSDGVLGLVDVPDFLVDADLVVDSDSAAGAPPVLHLDTPSIPPSNGTSLLIRPARTWPVSAPVSASPFWPSPLPRPRPKAAVTPRSLQRPLWEGRPLAPPVAYHCWPRSGYAGWRTGFTPPPALRPAAPATPRSLLRVPPQLGGPAPRRPCPAFPNSVSVPLAASSSRARQSLTASGKKPLVCAGVSSQSLYDELKIACVTRWIGALEDLGATSSLFLTVCDSPIRDRLLAAPITASSAGTLSKHLGFWDTWKEFASDPSLSSLPSGKRALFLAEFLCELSAGGRRKTAKKTVSCSSMISALVYVASKSGCDALVETLNNPLVIAFKTNPDLVWDRKECLPLPLAVVAAFEARVCRADTPQWEILIIGGFLVCLWGGVRWSEVQRCSPSSLVLDGHVVRAIAWRTKVAKSCQPFGFWTFGASGRPPHQGWAHRWINSLNDWIQTVRTSDPEITIDYLIPSVVKGNLVCRPMPYISALRIFRNFLSAPWMTASIGPGICPASYTLHLKATLTSWAMQCQLSEGMRADLAHHRLTGGRGSVRLYSRDDVFGALAGQLCIVQRLADGWRPLTPQARGGQAPLKEPAVTLLGPAMDWEAPVFPPLALRGVACSCSPSLSIANDHNSALPILESIEPLDVAVCFGSSEPAAKARRVDSAVVETEHVDSDDEYVPESALELDFSSYCFVANSLSGIAHMAGISDCASEKTVSLLLRGDSLNVRPLCGAQLPSGPGCCTVYTQFPSGFDLCRRLGCSQGPGCSLCYPVTLVPPIHSERGKGKAPFMGHRPIQFEVGV